MIDAECMVWDRKAGRGRLSCLLPSRLGPLGVHSEVPEECLCSVVILAQWFSHFTWVLVKCTHRESEVVA